MRNVSPSKSSKSEQRVERCRHGILGGCPSVPLPSVMLMGRTHRPPKGCISHKQWAVLIRAYAPCSIPLTFHSAGDGSRATYMWGKLYCGSSPSHIFFFSHFSHSPHPACVLCVCACKCCTHLCMWRSRVSVGNSSASFIEAGSLSQSRVNVGNLCWSLFFLIHWSRVLVNPTVHRWG